jgi:outer membrane protein TolC
MMGIRRGISRGRVSSESFRNRLKRVHSPPALTGSFGLAIVAVLATIYGCGNVADRPELNPYRSAPQSIERAWTPGSALASEYRLSDVEQLSNPQGNASLSAGQRYDLSSLIDVALRNNPQTRREWEAARSAAAQLGATLSQYYPQADVQSVNGYERTVLQLPGTAGTLKQWQAQPLIEMTYTLLDFGRRRSATEAARNRLIAQNFTFNRAIQTVVFNTQSAFYTLDAAQAAMSVAEQNLRLTETDLEAVKQRVDLGLATQPELLLARERVAQSRFDLASTRLLIHDAQAQMAVALGIPVNTPLEIAGLEQQAVPKSLNAGVDRLIVEARRERPDLAARVANLRASEAAVGQARAQFYPVAGLSADYGENLWNFKFSLPRTVQTFQPQYSALMTLKWEVFAGFRRRNDLRRAEGDREVARAELDSLEIDAMAQVWRAYYEFESSVSKYEYAQSLLTASQESYNANTETYHQGLSTIVELLTAQRDLENARYTLVQSKAQLLNAYAAVAYAAGAVRIP